MGSYLGGGGGGGGGGGCEDLGVTEGLETTRGRGGGAFRSSSKTALPWSVSRVRRLTNRPGFAASTTTSRAGLSAIRTPRPAARRLATEVLMPPCQT